MNRPDGRYNADCGGKSKVSSCSSLNHNPWRRSPAALELIAHACRDLAISLGVRAIGLGRHDRQAGIRLLTDRHMQRHLAQERHAQPLGFAARAAMAENVGARATLRALEVAHVLDD